MDKMTILRNQKGFTLIEILLGFLILSIVLTSFLVLFPQIATYNKKTNEMMTGTHFAKQQLVLITSQLGKDFFDGLENIPTVEEINADYPTLNIIGEIEYVIDEESGNYFLLYTLHEQQQLHSTIKIYEEPTFKEEDDFLGMINLYKVHVLVTENNEIGKQVTELFGYIEDRIA